MNRVLRELAALLWIVLIFGGTTFVLVVWDPWWVWRAVQALGVFIIVRFVVRVVLQRRQSPPAATPTP